MYCCFSFYYLHSILLHYILKRAFHVCSCSLTALLYSSINQSADFIIYIHHCQAMRKTKSKVTKSTKSWTRRKGITEGLCMLMIFLWFGIIGIIYTSIWEHSEKQQQQQQQQNGHSILFRLPKSNPSRQHTVVTSILRWVSNLVLIISIPITNYSSY